MAKPDIEPLMDKFDSSDKILGKIKSVVYGGGEELHLFRATE